VKPRISYHRPTDDTLAITFSEATMQASAALPTTNIGVGTIANQWPALGVLLFGLVFLYAIGFSTLPRVHNATHDTRHATGFPCH
jgi:cobalt transporter subunit CbtB